MRAMSKEAFVVLSRSLSDRLPCFDNREQQILPKRIQVNSSSPQRTSMVFSQNVKEAGTFQGQFGFVRILHELAANTLQLPARVLNDSQPIIVDGNCFIPALANCLVYYNALPAATLMLILLSSVVYFPLLRNDHRNPTFVVCSIRSAASF